MAWAWRVGRGGTRRGDEASGPGGRSPRGRGWRARASALILAGLPLLAGAAAAESVATPLAHYSVTRWTTDDGLPQNQIHDVRQAANGFLWLATWEGVARFDGREFRPLGSGWRRPARRLLPDGDGMLVGGIQAGLWRFGANGEGVDACPDQPRMNVWSLSRAADGTVWIASDDGLYRLERDGRCAPAGAALAPLRRELLQDVLAAADGSLWIGTRAGLYRYRAGRLEQAGVALGLPAGTVRALAQGRDGELWIAGEHGVWRLRGTELRQLSAERADAVLQDREGALWVATSVGDVLRLWQGKRERMDAAQGLLGRPTGALFEGQEGLLWLGTTHGLFRISNDSAWAIGQRQGLVEDFVRSVAQDRDGQVWIGHADGLSRWRDGRVDVVYPRPGVERSSALSLAPSRDGGLWVGTYNRGVLRVGRGEKPAIEPLPMDADLAGASIRALLEDADGSLWIGSERGVWRWRDGVLAHDAAMPALPVRAFHRAPDGRLWVGFQGGMASRTADGRTRVWQPERDFPAGTVFDFHSDPDGALWIASDNGILRLRGERFDRYGEDSGLPANSLFRIFDDGFGNLWFTCYRGVLRVPRSAFAQVDRGQRQQLDLALFDHEDGMPSRQANGGSWPAGWRLDDGRLWVATAAGVAVFDPARIRSEHARRVPLVIDRVLVDGRAQPLERGAIAVPPGARVAVEYAGASMRQPHNLRYRYRIRGFDRGWIEAEAGRVASYTNLPPGDLQFEVQVARAPVDWSKPADTATLRFRVEAPWWRQPWLLALAVLALLAAPLLVYRLLGRRQRQRQQQLEALVTRRTEELSEKNRQLEVASWRLEYQASHDALTGLPNRRAGDLHLDAAVARAQADASPLCVALLDIDHFKQVNDRHGHPAGDAVLQAFAGELSAFAAEWGLFAARFGGEEFLLCMEEFDLPAAARCVGELLRRIRAQELQVDGGVRLRCTFSAGVARFAPSQPAHLLLAQADDRLLRAKQDGRDRVVAD